MIKIKLSSLSYQNLAKFIKNPSKAIKGRSSFNRNNRGSSM